MTKLNNLFKSSATVYIFATLIAIATTLASIFHAGIINTDGILYMRVAQTWLEQGTHAAIHEYSWAFYSILVANLSKILSLSLQSTAYLFNIFFNVLIVVYFIRLVEVLGGNKRTQWFALFVIISLPYLIDYRGLIIRDLGYWAGYLASLFYLIRYCKNYAYSDCCKTVISLAIASLFRVEGLLFFMLTPYVFLIIPALQQRKKHFLRFFITTGSLSLLTLVIAWLTIGDIGKLFHQWGYLERGFTVLHQTISNKIYNFSTLVLDTQSQRSAALIIITGLIGYVIIKLIKVINPLYFFLISWGIYKKLIPTSRTQIAILIYFLCINLFVISYFIGIFFFLTGRYCLGFAITSLLFVPFVLDNLYQKIFVVADNKGHAKQKLVFSCLLLLMLVMGLYGFFDINSNKRYLYKGGHWISENITGDQQMITNSAPVLFYAKGSQANWQVEYNDDIDSILSSDLNQNAFIALRISKNNKHFSKKLAERFESQKPLLTFSNKNDEILFIFQNK